MRPFVKFFDQLLVLLLLFAICSYIYFLYPEAYSEVAQGQHISAIPCSNYCCILVVRMSHEL